MITRLLNDSCGCYISRFAKAIDKKEYGMIFHKVRNFGLGGKLGEGHLINVSALNWIYFQEVRSSESLDK